MSEKFRSLSEFGNAVLQSSRDPGATDPRLFRQCKERIDFDCGCVLAEVADDDWRLLHCDSPHGSVTPATDFVVHGVKMASMRSEKAIGVGDGKRY